MITVFINGIAESLSTEQSVLTLLKAKGLADKRIAVECNNAILPRSQHHAYLLKEGDRLEIVHAIGGG